ncbi:hypothetical protein EYC84_003624 [Monilinia fructicola]|uniref:Uncharacterized protein n=1 Tax=Monilinia fructicola TaxID=38448 RepID=A0A5M9JWS1_MONFR|nr:hypothetical protein EYC84_003624 [Monilinia fructicola]
MVEGWELNKFPTQEKRPLGSPTKLCGFVPSTWVLSYEDLLLALRSAGRAYKHVNKAQIQNWIYAYIYASVIYNQHACYAVLRDLHSREKTV